MKENRKWVEQQKGEDDMGPVLMEIMEPELREDEKRGKEKGLQEGIRKGIYGTVNVLRNRGMSRDKIIEAVMEQYGLSEKETVKFL